MNARDLRRVFDVLEAKGLAPEPTSDGRGLVADCPCCGEPRGLLIHLDGRASEGDAS